VKINLLTAIMALMISTIAVCSFSDPIVIPVDPVEAVRASENAWLSKGDWRIYLSKRWQDVITPTIMNGINFQRQLSEDRIQKQTKDKDVAQASVSKQELKDVKLVNATDSTAIVDYTLSITTSSGSRDVTYHDYLIKEDGHWARDVISPNMRPEWAMPADLKPIYHAISEILQQEHSALCDDQGKPRHDPAAVEAFAKKNFAAESLLYISAKEFAENSEKAVTRSKYANRMSTLMSMVMDIMKTWTFEQTEYVVVNLGDIVCLTNDKNEFEAGINGIPGCFVKEQGSWKRLLVADSKQIGSRFLQLWHDKNKSNMALLLAADAKFDMGTGKSLSWDEFSKNLPIPDQISDVTKGGNSRNAILHATLHFTTNESGCKSGVYEIAFTSLSKRAYLTQNRIISLRYVDNAVKPQANNTQKGTPGAAVKPSWHYEGGQIPVWVSGNHNAKSLNTAAGTTKYEMIDLGALTHLSDSQATAINNTGLILFGDIFKKSISLFLWQDGKVQPLKDQGYSFVALNDSSQIAGVKITDFNKAVGTAALWQNGKITLLGAIGENGLWPSSINNKGQIAGLTTTKHGYRAAIWEKGNVRILETPAGAADSGAIDINASGQVVGRAIDVHNVGHAYLWQAGKSLDLGVLPTCTQSECYSINDKGHVIGRSFGPEGWDTGKGDLRSFIWVNGVMRDLGSVLGGNRITACSINNNDDVVGYASRADGETRGFILKHGRVTDLGVRPKGTASYATAINDNGWIIGYATTANGKNHAVLWRPVKKAK